MPRLRKYGGSDGSLGSCGGKRLRGGDRFRVQPLSGPKKKPTEVHLSGTVSENSGKNGEGEGYHALSRAAFRKKTHQGREGNSRIRDLN